MVAQLADLIAAEADSMSTSLYAGTAGHAVALLEAGDVLLDSRYDARAHPSGASARVA